jgi:hypothetical protein
VWGLCAILADRRGASLPCAHLFGADLRGAALRDARFGPGTLPGPSPRHPTPITGAWYDGATRWPTGFDPRRRGMVRLP